MSIIRLFILGLAAFVAGRALANEITESGCEVFLSSKQTFVPLPELHVLGGSHSQSTMDISSVKKEDVKAIRCTRSSVVPVASDSRVLDAGWPLYIASPRPNGQAVIVVLEVSAGQYRLRTVNGELNGPESQAVQQALNEIQNEAQQAVPADRPKAGSR